jgi:thiamine biosynthesis lipoprotein
MRVDVSSIAQGYTVRKLAALLEQAGVTNYLVEVGGELQVRGKKPAGQPWKVAIEKPLPGEQHLQKIITVNQDEPLAIMTSGTYRHYFDADGQRFSHVLDARAGAPVRHNTVSTTVLIDNATFGDAWSTAFLCLGSEAGLKVADELGLKVLFIDQQGDALVEKSSQALAKSKDVSLQ